ncbi:hypothetical protein BC628DRAFT_1416645 [Trametes gibbosa]|nr:hypothetical protein BC628DRAFT_1416645 [Trametes gibbosa]
MPPSPAFNIDILLEIASIVSWEDSRALFQTCRSLYLEGPKAFFQRQPASLTTKNQLRRLMNFLCATFDDKRHTYVCALHLEFDVESSDHIDYPLSQLLASDLLLMSNLSSFCITGSEDHLLIYLALFLACASLTTLRKLSLSSVGGLSANMLQMLQSNLVFAHIRSHEEVAPDPALVYPEMRYFSLAHSTVPLTIVLVRAYPNLHCVQNFESNTSQAHPGHSWSTLFEYHGDLVDLYLLSLICYIDRVELNTVHRLHLPIMPEPEEGSDSLVHLFAAETDEPADMDALMESLLSSLQHTPIEAIWFTIDVSITP